MADTETPPPIDITAEYSRNLLNNTNVMQYNNRFMASITYPFDLSYCYIPDFPSSQ